jgi:soluble epoxide hydrolase/lipid-phosphate phosphatase
MDPSSPLALASRQAALCDDLTTQTIKTGHWIFEQDPKGAAEFVFEWGTQKGLL